MAYGRRGWARRAVRKAGPWVAAAGSSIYAGFKGRSKGGTAKRQAPKRRQFVRAKVQRRFRPRAVKCVEPSTIQAHKFVLTVRRPRKLYKPLGVWTYHQQNTGRLTAGVAQQGVATILGHATVSQLFTGNSAPDGTQFTSAAFNLNPYQYTTGNLINVLPVVPSQDRIHLKNVITDFQMTNNSNSACSVLLYWVMSRVSHTGTPTEEWTDALAAENLFQATAGNAVQSSTAYGPGAVGVPLFSAWGQSPQSLRAWRGQFRVLRSKMYYLALGATQRVNYVVRMNSTYDKTITGDYFTNSAGFPGKTVWMFMVVRGVPADIVATASGNADVGSRVTTSGNEIMWTASTKYTFTSLGAQRLDYKRSSLGFPTLFDTTVKLQEMGPEGVELDVGNA